MQASYGDVIDEYRALTEHAALVTGAHDVLWVTGRDAASFLQGIISQDTEGLEGGGVARAFFLSPQGKLRALLWVAKLGDRVALVVDGGQGVSLAESLSYYRIRVKAEISVEQGPIWEVWGPQSGEVVGHGRERSDDTVVIPIPMRGLDRFLVIGARPEGVEVRAGSVATAAARVEFGEPVFGVDVDESTIPQETGLTDAAVSFTKGCYLGQELVARIDSRGRVNRLLRSVAVTRNVLPPEGAAVFDGDREVGAVTSVTESLTSPVGLALLRREVEVGSTVTIRWEGGEAPAIVRTAPVRSEA
jgi:tRNA-modifying protein YgfZ